MNRVAFGELYQWLRNCVADQLTQNPERPPLGVLAFTASVINQLRQVVVLVDEQRSRHGRQFGVTKERSSQTCQGPKHKGHLPGGR
jgi:hypothetical protein